MVIHAALLVAVQVHVLASAVTLTLAVPPADAGDALVADSVNVHGPSCVTVAVVVTDPVAFVAVSV
jgi:hypothetical protein